MKTGELETELRSRKFRWVILTLKGAVYMKTGWLSIWVRTSALVIRNNVYMDSGAVA